MPLSDSIQSLKELLTTALNETDIDALRTALTAYIDSHPPHPEIGRAHV